MLMFWPCTGKMQKMYILVQILVKCRLCKQKKYHQGSKHIRQKSRTGNKQEFFKDGDFPWTQHSSNLSFSK